MSAGEIGDTTQERDLMRLLRNTRWETEACAGYAVDAEAAGDGRFATCFRDVQKTLRTSSSGRRKCSSTEADEFLPAFDRTANRPRGIPATSTRAKKPYRVVEALRRLARWPVRGCLSETTCGSL
jgi:hypothetical protein